MIINLKGTNGAGKSTVVRRIMRLYQDRMPIMVQGRLKPIGYLLRQDGMTPLFIPGHYEIANGGIDTIRDIDVAYDLIKTHDASGRHVLYEGKNMQDRSRKISEFHPEKIRIICIDHPVDECIKSVRERGHTIREDRIVDLAGKIAADVFLLRNFGYVVETLDREAAFERCRELLT